MTSSSLTFPLSCGRLHRSWSENVIDIAVSFAGQLLANCLYSFGASYFSNLKPKNTSESLSQNPLFDDFPTLYSPILNSLSSFFFPRKFSLSFSSFPSSSFSFSLASHFPFLLLLSSLFHLLCFSSSPSSPFPTFSFAPRQQSWQPRHVREGGDLGRVDSRQFGQASGSGQRPNGLHLPQDQLRTEAVRGRSRLVGSLRR